MFAERKKPHTSILPYLRAKEVEAGKKPASPTNENKKPATTHKEDSYDEARRSILTEARNETSR